MSIVPVASLGVVTVTTISVFTTRSLVDISIAGFNLFTIKLEVAEAVV